MNAREAHAMLEAARQNPHLIAQVVLTTSQLPMDRTVNRLIAEGYVGDVLAIEANLNMTRGFIDRDAPFDWRLDADLTGFNRFPLGIAYEAVARWVGEAKRVMAMGTTFVKTRHDPQSGLRRTIRMPDHLDVVAEMVCGAQAHLGLSTVSGLAPEFAITIFGSEGTLRITLSELSGGQRGDESLTEIAIAPEEEGGWRFEEEFVNAIRGKEVIPHTTFDVGVKYMEFTEAVARSMADGRAISLPL
jgi:predicted dehydrogenase